MIYYNSNYKLKKTFLGKLYLANLENGDIIEINDVTADIVNIIANSEMTLDKLFEELCKVYNVNRKDIENDVNEIIHQLTEYNVLY